MEDHAWIFFCWQQARDPILLLLGSRFESWSWNFFFDDGVSFCLFRQQLLQLRVQLRVLLRVQQQREEGEQPWVAF
jgi:hypothetical protein